MARQKTSPIEDVILIVSKLPWWAGLTLALVSYLVLHAIASRPIMPANVVPGQMGDAAARGVITSMAMFGQIVLPFAFGFGAFLSGIRALRQKMLYDKVAARPGIHALNEMSWADFERLVSEYYRRNGFQVSREGGNGPDGGVDLVLRQKSETYLVQCKQWKAYKVGVLPVREFYGVMSARGVAGGYFVTSGKYTEEAKTFSQGLNITLIDGRRLREMIDVASKIIAVSAPTSPTPAPMQSVATSPVCPKCSSEIKKRVARQGTNAGKEFWGCISYPKCNGARSIESVTSDRTTDAVIPELAKVADIEKRKCPDCGTELVLRQFQSGPKAGQRFYGCVPCKKGWPVELASS
jgi:restriction system protein